MKITTVQDKLAEGFREYPGNIALECGRRHVTYNELRRRSAHIAGWILSSGIEKGTYAGICIADRIDFITALLGILKAGCVFVPLDQDLPANRIKKMLRLTGTGIVFSDGGKEMPVRTVLPREIMDQPEARPGFNEPLVTYGGEDIVYVEFKSGPSGVLTAAAGKNKSLVHLVDWEIDAFGIDESFRLSQTAPPGSGQFLLEVIPALCAGATVCIYEDTANNMKIGGHSIIFMFPGLGGQYVNMGLGLYREEPLFREEVDRCCDILKSETTEDIKSLLYPADGSELVEDALHRIDAAQLVVFIFEYALAQLLIKLGITPHAVIGYSFGEYTAACVAGVFSLTDALKLIVTRGELLSRLPRGAMISVPLPREQLRELLGEPGISLAIDNGPSCIVAGPVDAVNRLEQKLKQRKILTMALKASRAIHSPMVEPVLNEFREKLQGLTLKKPGIPLISNVTGDLLTETGALDPTYWINQLREPVRFADGVKVLLKERDAVFVEIGPGSDLSALIRYHTGNRPDCKVVDIVRNPNKKAPDLDFFFNALTRLEGRQEASGGRLTRWLEENRIRLFHCKPHFFHLIDPGNLGAGAFTSLTHVLLYGDRIWPGDLKKWYDIFGERIRLVNLYGAAEITLVKMYYQIQADDAGRENIPIGRPIKGARAIVLNKSMNICDSGITGDLYIRTPYRAAAYCGNPQLTGQRFIPNPFGFGRAPDDLIYKTGDTGKLLADGNIELVATPEGQVKIDGRTVNLAEIENTLLQYPGVKAAAVIKKSAGTFANEIAAYIAPHPGQVLSPGLLRGYLAVELPPTLIPKHIAITDAIPLLPDGKIDKSALDILTKANEEKIAADYKAPANDIEEKLVRIWQKILNKENIGVEDDFFEKGGHSLGIMTLAAEIYKTFTIEMTVPQLYRMPRIEDISKYIMGVGNGDIELPYMAFNAAKPRKIFLFPPKIAYGVEYLELAKLVTEYAFYAFNFIEGENIVATYVNFIKDIQSHGPYTLLGYSAGGNLAFEVAKGMEQAGCGSIDLILLDSFGARAIEGLDTDGQQDNYLDFVEKSLQARGLSFLKEKVVQKVKRYGQYLDNLQNTGLVNANIHFITAANRKELNDWQHLTVNAYKMYRGFGRHIEMLAPGFLEKNADIISEILRGS